MNTFDGLRLVRGCLEVGEVAVQRAARIRQPMGRRNPETAGRRVLRRRSAKSGLRQADRARSTMLVALLGGARIRRDAGDAVPNVGGVGRLAHLAVADHVDAGCDLPEYDLVNCLGGFRLEPRAASTARPCSPRENEIDQRFRPQAAGVGCEDAVSPLVFMYNSRVRGWRRTIPVSSLPSSVPMSFCARARLANQASPPSMS